MRVCLSTTHFIWNTSLGGHAWVFLNWALSLQAAGASLILYDKVRKKCDPEYIIAHLKALHTRLEELGLKADITLLETPEQAEILNACRTELETLTIPLERAAEEADLFVNFRYGVPQQVIDKFKCTALVDIDPGLLQMWISGGHVAPAAHDLYFSIGETVGQPNARFSDCGLDWIHTQPPVYLPAWPVCDSSADAPFTTVTNWWGEYELIDGKNVNNEKRTHFIAMIDLPSLTQAKLELAIFHESDVGSDLPLLESHGWQTRPSSEISSTAEQYRRYIQSSRGEFSCAKESCMVFQNAWVSDRTLCYLASGKPAVVQDTGPSRILPQAEGILRFDTITEAASHLNSLRSESTYREHSEAARSLVEEHFDGVAVMRRLLDRALAQPTTRRRTNA